MLPWEGSNGQVSGLLNVSFSLLMAESASHQIGLQRGLPFQSVDAAQLVWRRQIRSSADLDERIE
jgi:hypothetical protein